MRASLACLPASPSVRTWIIWCTWPRSSHLASHLLAALVFKFCAVRIPHMYPYVPLHTNHIPHTHTHTHTHENPSDTPAYLDIPPMLCGTSGQRVHPGRAGRTARRPSCLRAAKSPGGPQDKFPRERARGVCEPSGPCGRGHAAALTLQLRSARPPRRAQADCAPACPGGSPRPRARKQSRNSGDRATR